MNSLKFEWLEDLEKDFKELKAEFTAGKIQAYLNFDSFYSHHGLVYFEYRWYTVSKTGCSGAFYWLLG